MSLPLKPSILELLAPFVSTALLQLLHIGLLVSFGFPCSFASYPKYFQIALLLCKNQPKPVAEAPHSPYLYSLHFCNLTRANETRHVTGTAVTCGVCQRAFGEK